jgi:hypothetical protein
MLIRVLFIISLFASFGVQSQVLQWEKAHQRGYQHKLKQIFTTQNGEVILLSKVQRSQSIIFHSEVMRIGWDGTLTWSEQGFSDHLFPSNPLQTGELMGMGLSPSNCSWCAVGYSPSWSLLPIATQNIQTTNFISSVYEMNFDITVDQSQTQPTGFFYASNGDFLAFGKNVFYRNDWIGNQDNYTLSKADTLSEEVLYVTASNLADLGFAITPTQAGFIDTLGVFTPQFNFAFTVDSVGSIDSNSEFLLFSANSAYVLSDAFQLVDSVQWLPHFDQCRSMTYQNQTYHLLGTQNGALWVKSISNNQVVGSFEPDTQKVDFRLLASSPSADKFILIGYETSVQNDHLVIQMYGSEAPELEKTNYNLAVTEVVEKPIEAISCLPDAPNPEYYIYRKYAAMVKVSNLGLDTISRFYLNGNWEEVAYYPSFICPFMNCRDSVLSQEFENMPIPPGEFVWVEVSFLEGLSPIQVQPFCVWVSTPDGQPDRVPEDDQICLDIVLSTEEQEIKQAAFQLWPNPTNDGFRIQHNLSGDEHLAKLVDMQGRLLASFPVFASDAWIALPESISAGMYMVQLFDKETLLGTRKLLVQPIRN